RRYTHMLTPILAVGDQVTFWLYFIARVTATLQAQEYRQKAYPLSWVFLAVECLIAFPNILWETWQLTGFKHRKRPMLRLVGDVVPTCDLFVTTCGEEVDQVMDTVRAACFNEYPMDRFRVVVLDDGKNDELREAVEKLAILEFPNLFYYARTKIPGQPHHFKAGNLNGGIAFVDSLAEPYAGGGEFLAALDADMLCTSDMLRALLPHLLLNPKLAMSCPPQLFYNTPTDDPLYESLDYFAHVAEVLKDALGVAWCTGSGYCVRRSAVDDIGGFPYGSLAEDVCFSSMLLGKGWQCAYVHEPLQWGTVPDSFEGHIKQRTRWIIGTIQTTIKLNFCLFGQACNKMTIFQRLCGCMYGISSIFSVFLTLACLTVPIVLFSSGSMVAFVSVSQLKLLIRLCFINFAWRKVAEFFYYSPSGYWFGRRESPAAIWMAPYYSYCIIRSFVLPKWLGGKVMAFSATGAARGGLKEWYKDERANIFKRIFVMVWHHNLWYHVTIITFTLGSIGYSSWRCTMQPTWEATVGCLILRPLWPPPAWFILTAAFFVPIGYMLFPPDCPQRHELITYDEKGVASPKESARKTVHTWRTVLGDLPVWFCLIWSAALFAGTWF
ncbi:nucleotide-diphospho-sugar transferase, partial [Protomyces lactucae-debilis]